MSPSTWMMVAALAVARITASPITPNEPRDLLASYNQWKDSCHFPRPLAQAINQYSNTLLSANGAVTLSSLCDCLQAEAHKGAAGNFNRCGTPPCFQGVDRVIINNFCPCIKRCPRPSPAPSKSTTSTLTTPKPSSTTSTSSTTSKSVATTSSPSTPATSASSTTTSTTSSTTTSTTSSTTSTTSSTTSTTSSTTSTTSSTTSSTPPPTCGNQGVQWAYYFNPFGSDSDADYSEFDPTIFKTATPDETAVTYAVGGFGYPPDHNVQIYQTGPAVSTDNFALNHRGYIYAPQTGAYTFQFSGVNDVALVWIGPVAYSGWVRGNELSEAALGSGGSSVAVFPMVQGQYYALRVVFGQVQDSASLSLDITTPDGKPFLNADSGPSPYLVQFSCDGTTAPPFPPYGQET